MFRIETNIENIMKPFILFLTGSSGAGKTTLLQSLEHKYSGSDFVYLYFDSIGVPSQEDMIKDYGSGEAWQKATTEKWIEKITTEYKDKEMVIIEGQVRPLFIIEAFNKFGLTNFKIVLIHCDNKTRNLRLFKERNQPELVTADMDNWSKYLKDQAEYFKIPVIDTSKSNLEEALTVLQNEIIKKRP